MIFTAKVSDQTRRLDHWIVFAKTIIGVNKIVIDLCHEYLTETSVLSDVFEKTILRSFCHKKLFYSAITTWITRKYEEKKCKSFYYLLFKEHYAAWNMLWTFLLLQNYIFIRLNNYALIVLTVVGSFYKFLSALVLCV